MMEESNTSIVASGQKGLFRGLFGVLSGLGIRAGAAFAIQAELRLLRGPVHFDPQVGPRSMFGEEGVSRPENPALPSGHGLRNLRIQFERSMEVDHIFVQVV